MRKWLEKCSLRFMRNGPVPKHIAFIMDGNRRWATNHQLKKHEGHSFGLEKLKEVIEWCLELGVGIISVFAFSTENFNRSEEEVKELMDLFLRACTLLSEKSGLIQTRGVRIRVVGDLHKFPIPQQEALKKLEHETSNNNTCVLNICLGYGSIEEVSSAVESIRKKIASGIISSEEVSRTTLEAELMIKEPVDLMIRTGESRLSNFLLYQSSETTKFKLMKSVLWPNLKIWHMVYIIFSYQYLL